MFKCSQRFKQCVGQSKHTEILAWCGLDSFSFSSPASFTPLLPATPHPGYQFSVYAFHSIFCLIVVCGCKVGGCCSLKLGDAQIWLAVWSRLVRWACLKLLPVRTVKNFWNLDPCKKNIVSSQSQGCFSSPFLTLRARVMSSLYEVKTNTDIFKN